jgi:flagellar biosynthesis/type III secretory pathway protein FliH
LILEEATLSYSRSIKFSSPPKGFKVNQIALPPVPVDQSSEKASSEYERGKREATAFYQVEIQKLRDSYGKQQTELLSSIDAKTNEVFEKLDHRLPDLVIGLAERVLGQVSLDKESIEKIVRNMISEFSGDDEKLDVYLCPTDLALLKSIADSDKQPIVDEKEEGADGFASAIAGIFDGLDGDDALLEGYPNVKFFEDSSLQSGDCQIKSRFGLLDGRVSTKIRKIEDELKRND